MRNRPGHGGFRRISAQLLVITSAAALRSAAAAPTRAADSPAGFWSGADGRTITIPPVPRCACLRAPPATFSRFLLLP